LTLSGGVDLFRSLPPQRFCKATGGDPLNGSNDCSTQLATIIIAILAGVAATIVIVISEIKFLSTSSESREVGKDKRPCPSLRGGQGY